MSIPIPSPDVQLKALLGGIVVLNTFDALQERLLESYTQQRPLKIKCGFDPTAADLHVGHSILMEKLAQFQRLGHQVVFLVGDYTARIGDPTGRNSMRPPLTDAQIQAHAQTYTAQCFKILDRNCTHIEWNSKWLSKLTFNDMISLASKYNLSRMLERRDFKDRFENNRQIALHELLYPLIQGYDSVVLQADVEMGGHDQIFNLNIGRYLMEAYGQRPQIVMTVGLLVGLDGQDKMSKSKGNHIGVGDPADEMFGKVMSISDATLWKWLPILTQAWADPDTSFPTHDPLICKKALAHRMVTQFWGPQAAQEITDWWNAGRPVRNQPPCVLAPGPLQRLVLQAGAAGSGQEARRKIIQGGVSLNDQRCLDPMKVISAGTYLLRVGKKWAMQIVVHQPPA